MNSIYGNIDDLYLFFCVVEEGSLQKASAKLHLPISTMSRRLSLLEQRLGFRLLEKRGRELVATESGDIAFSSLQSVMEHLEYAFDDIQTQTQLVSGTIRLALPNNFYRTFVAEVVEQFIETYPLVNIELMLSQDLSSPASDRDLAMTFDLSGMEGMVARPLFSSLHQFYTSQAYLDRYGPIETVKQLADADWILTDRHSDITVYQGEHVVEVIKVKPKLVINDINAVTRAVEKGMGVASLPVRKLAKHLELLPIMEQFHRGNRQSYLVYRARKYQPKALSLFIDALIGAARTIEDETPIIDGETSNSSS